MKNNMNINDMIYVHIPKTGGFSMCASLRELNYNNWFGHMPANEIKNSIGEQKFNNKFVFTIIRNPWERLLSAYKFVKFGSSVHKSPQVLPEYQYFKKLNTSNFEEFVEVLYNNFKIKNEVLMDINSKFQQYLNPNYLVMNQYSFIYDNNNTKLVNYIGHLDKLEESIEDIFNITNVRIPLPKMGNVSKGGENKISISDKYVDIIGEMYYKDINEFNFKYL